MTHGYCILVVSVMTAKSRILLILFIAGLIILLLPDVGKPIIVLNENHGPSLLDIAGLLLMFASWFLSCIVIAKRWEKIKLKIPNSAFVSLIIIYILSVIGVALSLLLTSDIMLWLCAAIAGLINILFVIYAFGKS